MEILRSTEVLDKEIRAECQQKVLEIQSATEKESQKILSSVAERLSNAESELRKKSEETLSVFERNVKSYLPLQKQRECVSFVNKSIENALSKYINSLTQKKRLLLLKHKAEDFIPVLNKKEIMAQVSGFDLDIAEDFLREIYGQDLKSVAVYDGVDFDFQGFLLTANDGSVKCILTLAECMQELMNEKSLELASVLFCGRVPE